MAETIHKAASKGYETTGDSYERGRPEYPKEAIEYLSQEVGLSSEKTVVDLGAGTGKFTKLISLSGAKVVAIEPVAGMRKNFLSFFLRFQLNQALLRKFRFLTGRLMLLRSRRPFIGLMAKELYRKYFAFLGPVASWL